jgi:hypothetical protein
MYYMFDRFGGYRLDVRYLYVLSPSLSLSVCVCVCVCAVQACRSRNQSGA